MNLTNRPSLIEIKPRASAKGFTLVELLVVITIIVVLAALSTVGITKIRSSARGPLALPT